MGLGKTVEVLALILAHPWPGVVGGGGGEGEEGIVSGGEEIVSGGKGIVSGREGEEEIVSGGEEIVSGRKGIVSGGEGEEEIVSGGEGGGKVCSEEGGGGVLEEGVANRQYESEAMKTEQQDTRQTSESSSSGRDSNKLLRSEGT